MATNDIRKLRNSSIRVRSRSQVKLLDLKTSRCTLARCVLANVAQLVEQLTRNEQVVGSTPTVGSIAFSREAHGADH